MMVATHRRSRGRRGYALVELLVVMSVNSVLIAVAVALLCTLLRSGHEGQYHYERTTALMRLADQFRGDIAAARDASVIAGSSAKSLQLSGPNDITVELTCDGDRICRIEKEGSALRRREAYRLVNLSQAEFIVSELKLVTLVLIFRDDARGIGDIWRIDAQLAKDWRYAEAEANP
jgi:prepilin-type N-terminal cleavage/methylation domain-containing protein